MEKKTFYTETAYILGLVFLALGVVFMERPDFGVSMVVAPAYILYLKISQYRSFFTFGMAEYTLQAVLLILMCLVLRKFRLSYLLSFVTAFIYGVILDVLMWAVNPLFDLLFAVSSASLYTWVVRIVLYLIGWVLGAIGVSMVFHTYISPEVYELFVKEVSGRFNIGINRFKTGYDVVSAVIGVLMSFAFFGLWHFEGVRPGTVLNALVNGRMIGYFSKRFEERYEFKDRLDKRPFFTGEKPLR